MDKKVNVKFNGGREVSGTLKGYDALMNLVLDDVEEVMRGLCPSIRSRLLRNTVRALNTNLWTHDR